MFVVTQLPINDHEPIPTSSNVNAGPSNCERASRLSRTMPNFLITFGEFVLKRDEWSIRDSTLECFSSSIAWSMHGTGCRTSILTTQLGSTYHSGCRCMHDTVGRVVISCARLVDYPTEIRIRSTRPLSACFVSHTLLVYLSSPKFVPFSCFTD